jgi:putative transcriptional regulator
MSLPRWLIVLLLIRTPLWGAQKQEDKMVYLVARRALGDPFFVRSAVLMLPSTDLPLVVGLIINRPTRIPLSQLFPKNPAFKNKTENAYFGGPVDVRDLSVAFRTSQPPKGAIRLVNDVYLSFDPHLIDTLLSNLQGTQDVRVFLGRSQWSPAQLQNEILQGAWYSVEAESKLIFAADPQQVWQTLLNHAEPANVVDYRVPAPGGGFTRLSATASPPSLPPAPISVPRTGRSFRPRPTATCISPSTKPSTIGFTSARHGNRSSTPAARCARWFPILSPPGSTSSTPCSARPRAWSRLNSNASSVF